MENTYDYIFWHNYLNGLWYAIPRDNYLKFFGSGIEDDVLKSKDINVLVELINKPEKLSKLNKKSK